MKSSSKKWIGAGVVVALGVVGIVALTTSGSGGAEDKDLIITAAVERQTLREEVALSGTLGRVEQRQVNAASEGRISRVFLDDGVEVAPDQAVLAVDGRQAVAVPGEFSFYRSLDVGAEGPDVRQLEQILAAAGYSPGSVDTLYTEQTRFALAQWQAAREYPGASAQTAKTVTVSLQPSASGYTVGPQNTAAVTIGPELGAPQGAVGRARRTQTSPRQSGALPRLSIRAVSSRTVEGTPASFVVEVDTDTTSPIEFTIEVGGNATPDDVIAPLGNITIPPGARQFSLQIPTVADGASEGDEELLVRLVDGAGYDLGDPASASTVLSSGDLPEVSITGGTIVNEGGTVKLAFSGGGTGGDVQVGL